jgi:uncharacterized membrane protein YebE (DUF533 family)
VQASFVDDRQCDVSIYAGDGLMQKQGYDLNARWRAYCDCMFQDYALVDTYWIDSVELKKPAGLPDNAFPGYVNSLGKGAVAQGKKFEIRVEKRPVVTQNWTRCVSHFCASPAGCGQPDGRVDPFSPNPGMLADPWTEVGSATRGIPMRAASGDWRWIRDLAAITVIDMSEYDPVALWKTMWTNPAKFTLLVIKAQLVPFMSPYILILSAPEQLVWKAAEQINARTFLGPDRMEKYLLKPVLEGNISFWKLAIQYLGRCGIGVNVPCGIGEVLQQACKDQITDRDANGVSELEKISDPTIRASVVFLSQHGSELVQKAINSIQGLKDLTILAWLEMVFRQILNEPLLQKEMKWDTKLALTLLATAAGVANVVYLGYQQKKTILEIADDIVDKLLGFRPSTVLAQLKGDVVAAKEAIQKGATRTGVSLTDAVGYITTVVKSLYSLMQTIKDVNDKIGGGLEDVVLLVKQAVDGMQGATDATKTVVASTAQALSGAAPISTESIKAGVTPASGLTKPTNPSSKQLAPATPAAASSSAGAAVAFAAGGFFVGGPVGALIGAGAALMMQKRNTAVAGYAAYAGLGFGAVTDLSTGQPRVSSIKSADPSTHSWTDDAMDTVVRTGKAIESTVEAGVDTLVSDSVMTARGETKAGPILLLGAAGLAAYMFFKPAPAKRLGSYTTRRKRK